MATLFAILAVLQVPTDKEADEALRILKEEIPKHGIEGRVAAYKEALKTPHEKVIHAMAEPLGKDAESVRHPIARALAEIDHPASVEVLVEAIPANVGRPEVMNVISAALGTLGWQTAAAPLHDLVRKVGDADVRAILPGVVQALGEIGSPSSVDVLVDFLVRVQGPRRNPWPNEGAIVKAAETALRAITGVDHRRGLDWQEWWKAKQGELVAKARRIYWSRKTHERTVVAPGEKVPEDSVLAATRITDPPAGAAGEPGKKKKKKP